MNWSNLKIDRKKPTCMFDKSNNDELEEVFNWKNTQQLLKEIHQQKGIDVIFLDCQLQFIKAFQLLRLNEEYSDKNLL